MSCVMRAGIDAAGFGVVMTQVTRCSFYVHAGDLPARMSGIVQFDGKRVKIDIAIRAVVGAQAAANTPVLDDDFEGVTSADGADGASNHAQGIATLPAGSGHQVFVEAKSLAYQPADAIMRVGTGSNTLITTGAALQIEHQEALRFHQSVR